MFLLFSHLIDEKVNICMSLSLFVLRSDYLKLDFKEIFLFFTFKDSDQLQQELKTNILQHSNSAIHRNDPSKRVEWPRGSIPRSVKKLSWDDETLEHDKIKNTKNDLRYGY